MNAPSPFRRPSNSCSHQRGVALVAVLAIIVLATFLITTYFTMTRFDLMVSSSYSKRISADQLATGFADVLTQDLANEIAAGSTIDGPNTPEPVYIPKFTPGPNGSRIDATGMLPAKFVSTAEQTAFPALLRRSSPTMSFDPYFDFGSIPTPVLASNVATDVATPQSRAISRERWNTPRLMDPGQLASFTPPNWIYWTETGPATAPPVDEVVGRVAYVMYDVSGLLDANVAGLPAAGTPSPSDQEKGAKGSLLLTNLDGLGTLTPPQSEQLAQWKYQNVAEGGFLDLLEKWSDKGFLTPPFRDPAAPGNRFVSRQDFLRYAETIGLPDTALPFFTTFSRELNEVSWLGPITPTAANPNLLTLRKSDDTLARLSRFPLSDLDWFNEPAANLDEIKKSFGLKDESTRSNAWDYVWEYDDDIPGTAEGEIADLSDVIAANRTPNFFELLKAGINADSLGQATEDRTHTETRYVDGSKLRHIMKIGVNAIDLTDENNYPFELVFPYKYPAPGFIEKGDPINSGFPYRSSAGYPYTRYEDHISGTEDIPYLSEIVAVVFRDNNGTSNTTQRGYFPIEVWNPHRPGGPSVPGPTQFRVRAHSGVSDMKFDGGGTSGLKHTPMDYRTNPATIQFSPDSNFSTAGIREPDMLRTSNSSTGGLAHSTALGLSAIPGPSADVKGGNASTRQPLEHYSGVSDAASEPLPTYSMEYQSGSGWQPYQDILAPVYRRYDTTTGTGESASKPFAWMKGMTSVDPRTTRFGLQEAASPSAIMARSSRRSSQSGMQESYFGTLKGPLFQPQNNENFHKGVGGRFFYSNFAENRGSGTGDKPIYQDFDGVTRPGDAKFDEGVNPMQAGDDTARPVILNRRFASVGELGYVGRDLPWKTLDFFSDVSADAALLDIFSVEQQPRVLAGKVNPNSAPRQVLEKILSGVHGDPFTQQPLSPAEVTAAADAITLQRTAAEGGPLLNRADLAQRVVGEMQSDLSWINSVREAPIRALADVSNVRTWNLMFDVIAQTGAIRPGATNLNEFALQGERRFWVHVAIDRFTREIVDIQTELVYE